VTMDGDAGTAASRAGHRNNLCPTGKRDRLQVTPDKR
jgi:hypothetical protein